VVAFGMLVAVSSDKMTIHRRTDLEKGSKFQEIIFERKEG
jgi:hypothetical protein